LRVFVLKVTDFVTNKLTMKSSGSVVLEIRVN
jgi:hypothetical protein